MINENRLTLLSNPDSLNFYLNDEDGCKQEIKIYNIHDFTINFKVLCTSVDNYYVEPPYGSIRPNCMINISIQLKNHDFDRKKDIFKIDACSKENDKIIGEKEITAYIKLEKPLEELIENRENKELKAAKLNDIYKGKKKSSSTANPVTIQLDQNVVVITAGRFCFYIILIFLFGMIVGMFINGPENQITLD